MAERKYDEIHPDVNSV